jgi:pimeloyl-ACP methyl ester carboxylesterase
VYEPNYPQTLRLIFSKLYRDKYDLKPQLSQFQKPALIIQGRQGFLGGWAAFKIYQILPNCEIEFIEKCGHFPHDERAGEFFEVLQAHLEKWN